VCALVAPSGSVEWMCLPRMDGPSIFAAMLDRHAAWFRLGPADVTVPSDRRYLAGTMVLETTWDTPTGLGGRPRRSPGRPVARRLARLERSSPGAVRSSGRAGAAAELERIDRSTSSSSVSPRSTTAASAASGTTWWTRTDGPRSPPRTASPRSD
jgi:hypothetical protein